MAELSYAGGHPLIFAEPQESLRTVCRTRKFLRSLPTTVEFCYPMMRALCLPIS